MAYDSLLSAFLPQGTDIYANLYQLAKERNLPGTYWGNGDGGLEWQYDAKAIHDLQRELENQAVSQYVPQELQGSYLPVNYGAGGDVLRDAQGRVLGVYRTGDDMTGTGNGQNNYLPWDILQKYPQLGGQLGTQYQEANSNPLKDPIFAGALGAIALGGMGFLGEGAGAVGGLESGFTPAELGLGGGEAAVGGLEAGFTPSELGIGSSGGGLPSIGGTMDASGALAYPNSGVTVANGMGSGTIYANAATPNALESFLGLPGGSLTGLTSSGNAAGGAGSALGRILDGSATTSDWLSVLGTAGATGLGILGSSQQASTIRDLANQSRADREPFRQAALGYLQNPASYVEGPGAATTDAVLRRLSVGGNPIGDPAKLGIATGAAMQDWRNAVLGFGNLGLSGEDTRAQLGLAGANADANVWNSLGYGLGQVTNPQKGFDDFLKGFKGFGGLGSGLKFSLT